MSLANDAHQQTVRSNLSAPAVPLSFDFPKSARLLESSQFKQVFDDAPFRASHQHFLILSRPNQHGTPRLGLVIAKKHLRKAVDRNHFKRLIRESFRHHQHKLLGIDIIVMSRKGLETLSNSDFNRQLGQQWQRIIKKSRQHGLTSTPDTPSAATHVDTTHLPPKSS